MKLMSNDRGSYIEIACEPDYARKKPVFWVKVFSENGQPTQEVAFFIFGPENTKIYSFAMERISDKVSVSVHPREIFEIYRYDDGYNLHIKWNDEIRARTMVGIYKKHWLIPGSGVMRRDAAVAKLEAASK